MDASAAAAPASAGLPAAATVTATAPAPAAAGAKTKPAKSPKAPAKKKPAAPRAKKAPATTEQPKKVAAKKRAPTPKARKGKQAAEAAPPAAEPAASSDGGAAAAVPETELRQHFLQQLYNLLHQAHLDQDPTAVGQYASALEMEHFQKFPTRNEYVNALNGELAKLSEIVRTGGAKASGGPGANPQNSKGATQSSGPATDQSTSTSSSFDAGRAQPHGAGGADASASRSYHQQQGAGNAQNQQAHYRGYAGAHAGSDRQPNGHAENASGASVNGQTYVQPQRQNAQPTAARGFEQQSHQAAQYYATSQPLQQQQQQQQHPSQFAQQQSRQEFVNQLQQYDRNVLIDFLWNQKMALDQWQSRGAQLEMQVASLQNALSMSYQQRAAYDAPQRPPPPPEFQQGPATGARSQRVSEGYTRGYPQQAQEQASVPVRHTLNEETLRAHDASMSAMSGNPEQYWRRVGVMRSMYLRDLTIAHHALENHRAPPNSEQSVKADNLKYNVSLALNVLHEAPQVAEPRSFDVLDSIERFMQNTVKPIVDRIQSRTAGMVSSATGGDNGAAKQGPNHQGGYSMKSEAGGAEATFRPNVPQQHQQQHQQQQQRLPSPPSRQLPRPSSMQSQPSAITSQAMPAQMARLVPPPREFPQAGTSSSAGGQSEMKLPDPSRLLNGQESPFGDFGAAKMSVPTFSPSERRTASAAQAAKDTNGKSVGSYEGGEDDMSAFDELGDMQFDDDGRKVAPGCLGNSSAGSETVSTNDK